MILDNRVRSCRNYVRFQLHIKNISNNSGDLSKKCTALGVMSPQLGKCLCRGQRMTQGWKLQRGLRSWVKAGLDDS